MGSLSEIGGRHTEGSRRLFDVCVPRVARALRFGLLPLALVANGHSFFVQQLQLQTGVWPHAVHATYQFEDQADCAFGKRERLREWGMWLADAHELRPWGGAADAGGGGGCAAVGGGEAAARLVTAEAGSSYPRGWRRRRWRPSCRGCLRSARAQAAARRSQAARQRLADGVLLAGIEPHRRAAAVPCYATSIGAAHAVHDWHAGPRSQPLPFVCPLTTSSPSAGGTATGRHARRAAAAAGPPRRRPADPRLSVPHTRVARGGEPPTSRALAARSRAHSRRRRRRVAADTHGVSSRRPASRFPRGRDGARAARTRADGRRARDATAPARVALIRAIVAVLRRF